MYISTYVSHVYVYVCVCVLCIYYIFYNIVPGMMCSAPEWRQEMTTRKMRPR